MTTAGGKAAGAELAAQWRLVAGEIDTAGAAWRSGNYGEAMRILSSALDEAQTFTLMYHPSRRPDEHDLVYERDHSAASLG